MRRSLALLLCIGMLLASCGDGDADEAAAPATVETTTSTLEPTTTTVVTTTAAAPEPTQAEPAAHPVGLSAEDLPATMAEVQAVFAAMPDEIDGVPREPAEYGFEARYGAFNGVVAVETAPGEGSESMAFFEDAPGAEIEASQLDPAAPLLWMFASFEDEGGAGSVQMAQWCEPEGSWIFAVNAETAAMRDVMVAAFVESAHAVKEAGPVEATPDIAALETLRKALPSEEELSAILGVPDVSLDVTGGPGITDWIFEHTETPGLIGGYMAAFRNPAGFAGTGSLSLTIFETEADAAAMLDGIAAEDEAEIIRSEFPVADLLAGGRGLVYDPEPDSHFTDIIGYSGPVLIHVLAFHGADDDLVDETRAIVEMVVTNLEATG
jgi:hypothetical protein